MPHSIVMPGVQLQISLAMPLQSSSTLLGSQTSAFGSIAPTHSLHAPAAHVCFPNWQGAVFEVPQSFSSASSIAPSQSLSRPSHSSGLGAHALPPASAGVVGVVEVMGVAGVVPVGLRAGAPESADMAPCIVIPLGAELPPLVCDAAVAVGPPLTPAVAAELCVPAAAADMGLPGIVDAVGDMPWPSVIDPVVDIPAAPPPACALSFLQ
jgi:hypothetical protein